MKPALALLVAFGLPAPAHADAPETARLVTHFDQVLAGLSAAPTEGVPPLAQARRAWLTGVLAEYREARQFPINPRFGQPTPYFVDDLGTRCAMAHLIEATGDTALVHDVATHHNNAHVRELADDARLVAWLGAAGLTVAEAAWIQPSYCVELQAAHCIATAELELDPDNTGLHEIAVLEAAEPARGQIGVVHGGSLLAVGDEVQIAVSELALEPGDQLLGYTNSWMTLEGDRVHMFSPSHRLEGDQAYVIMSPSGLEGGAPPTDDLAPVPLVDMIRFLKAGGFAACMAELVAEYPETDRTSCGGEWSEAGGPDLDDTGPASVDSDSDDGCSSTSAPASLGLGLLLLGVVRRRRR